MSRLDRDGDVAVPTLGDHENRMDPDRVRDWNALLDEGAHAEGPRALVTRGEGMLRTGPVRFPGAGR